MEILTNLTASEARERIRNKQLTSEALVEACLEKIDTREHEIGAWQHIDGAHALAQARDRDKESAQGMLHGVPVAVKDIIETHDMPTAYGSSIYEGYRSPWDAACIAACREAGAVILGKTVTTEFAYFHPGKTSNPHNMTHTPGGSSSGSAAAVSDGMVPIAFGSQTAGSVIRPASFCGIVGYKGTYGLFSMAGIKPFANSLDTLGVFTRKVADAALMHAVLLRIPLDKKPLTSPPRIGRCNTHEWPQADIATREAVDEAVDYWRAAGAEVVDISLPDSFKDLATSQLTIMTFESARAFAYEYNFHADKLSKHMKKIVEDGRAITELAYSKAKALANECRKELPALLSDYDILVAPSSLGAAPQGLDTTGDPLFNRIWTLLGVPCVNLPHYRTTNGLPVGVQIIGLPGNDKNLLDVSTWLEAQLT